MGWKMLRIIREYKYTRRSYSRAINKNPSSRFLILTFAFNKFEESLRQSLSNVFNKIRQYANLKKLSADLSQIRTVFQSTLGSCLPSFQFDIRFIGNNRHQPLFRRSLQIARFLWNFALILLDATRLL